MCVLVIPVLVGVCGWELSVLALCCSVSLAGLGHSRKDVPRVTLSVVRGTDPRSKTEEGKEERWQGRCDLGSAEGRFGACCTATSLA